jgi:hypothetical protein
VRALAIVMPYGGAPAGARELTEARLAVAASNTASELESDAPSSSYASQSSAITIVMSRLLSVPLAVWSAHILPCLSARDERALACAVGTRPRTRALGDGSVTASTGFIYVHSIAQAIADSDLESSGSETSDRRPLVAPIDAPTIAASHLLSLRPLLLASSTHIRTLLGIESQLYRLLMAVEAHFSVRIESCAEPSSVLLPASLTGAAETDPSSSDTSIDHSHSFIFSSQHRLRVGAHSSVSAASDASRAAVAAWRSKTVESRPSALSILHTMTKVSEMRRCHSQMLP